jgi:hypothetical protein
MSCNRGFLYEHIQQMFPKVFLQKEYKAHRQSILFEREKCMLPGSQAELEVDEERRLLQMSLTKHRDTIAGINEQLLNLSYTWKDSMMVLRVLTPDDLEKKQDLTKHMKEVKVMKRHISDAIHHLRFGGQEDSHKIEQRQFVKKCPGADCNGFLSSQWKCSLCHVKVCNKCLEIKGTGAEDDGHDHERDDKHTCDPENVKTAALIAKDTKPCPSCGTRIFKIAGCSQMWCTSCHVAFDWNTLRVQTGIIHNPHFYEYQRTQNGGVAPRVPGDVPGGCDQELPYVWTCMARWRSNFKDDGIISMLTDMHRLLSHIRNWELPLLPNEYVAANNNDIRKRFLTKAIDEKHFKWVLQYREKRRCKGKETRQLFDMFVACATDMLRKSLEKQGDPANDLVSSIFHDFNELVIYFNNHASKIQDVYGGVVPNVICDPKVAAGGVSNTKNPWVSLKNVPKRKKCL